MPGDDRLPPLGVLGRLLMLLSRTPSGREDEPDGKDLTRDGDSLARLLHVYPDLPSRIEGKRLLDFGCGTGEQVVALAKAARVSVLGVDVQESYLVQGRRLALEEGVADRTRFLRGLPKGERFDWIVSQNSMEHFSNPRTVLDTLVRCLAPDGRMLITFCPTWLSPYGAHMHFFTPVPWVHLLFPERAVMAVRARFRNDGAMRYEDVEGGLNRMTVRRFDRLVGGAGLVAELSKDEYVKGLSFLGRFPPTAEFFTNRVARVLRKSGNPPNRIGRR